MSNVLHFPEPYLEYSCGLCDNNTFYLSGEGELICVECETPVSSLRVIEIQEPFE